MMRPFTAFILVLLTYLSTSAQQSIEKDSVRALNEIVVSASRTPEDIVKSPISIEYLDKKTIQYSAKSSYFDALENVKGLQLMTSSLGFKVYNSRGFANPTNVRFVQLVDGIDNQAPHIGAAIASTLTPTDLDIEHVEVILGSASALWGLNALNGMVNLYSLSPFDKEGLSYQQKNGFNHLNSLNATPKLLNESSLRYAKVFNTQWAFKVNLFYLSGYDWISDNQTDLNPNGNSSLKLFGLDNPAIDPINSYGNESSNRRSLTLSGKRYSVARTGYYEKEISDFGISNFKADASLYFRPTAKSELIYTFRYGIVNNLYQRTNRFRLEDYRISQHSIQYKDQTFQVRSYLTTENTGDSYNIRSMAENIDKAFKTDDVWFADFTKSFNTSVLNGLPEVMALKQARLDADKNRPQPKTAEFDALIEKLRKINNWDIGAALQVRTWMFHTDGQADLTKELLGNFREKTNIQLLAGFDYRNYWVYPDGNYFINPTDAGKNISYNKTGGFLQATKNMWTEKLKLVSSIRIDKNQYFDPQFNYRFASVFSNSPQLNIRASYQNGYRFPSLFEAFSNVNSGGVKRVGGLRIMSNGIFENSYFKTSIDAFQAAVTAAVNTQGIPVNEAIKQNAGLLKKNDYSYIQPEKVQSFELDYKGYFLEKRLFFDIDFYYNRYRNFMAQVEANIPKSQNPDSIAIYLNNRNTQSRYRLWTNSKAVVHTYGSSMGLKYRFYKNFLIVGNVSYATLQRKDSGDGLEEAFNTPKWISNIALQNPDLFKNVGFSLSYRYQDKYIWQSSLATGEVPAMHNVDVQLSYRVPSWKLNFKLASTNVLNKYYSNFLAGPSVGGFYYFSITYN